MKKTVGGFVPPPFIMAKFIQNAAALIPASIISGVRLFQNKTHKKRGKSIISSKKYKKKKSIKKHKKSNKI